MIGLDIKLEIADNLLNLKDRGELGVAQGRGNLSLTLEKVVPVSVERAYQAWVDTEQFIQWFGAPSTICMQAQWDVRMGGKFNLEMAFKEGFEQFREQFGMGQKIPVKGEFMEVIPNQRLVFTWPDGESGATSLVTVEFKEMGPTTRIVLHHSHITDSICLELSRTGWAGCLDGLEVVLSDTAI